MGFKVVNWIATLLENPEAKTAGAELMFSSPMLGMVVKSRDKTGPGARIATFNYNFVTGRGMFDNKDLKENN